MKCAIKSLGALVKPLALALTLLSASLCFSQTDVQEDWPMYRHDLSNTGATNETHITSQNFSAYSEVWTFKTGNNVSASPTVATVLVNGTKRLTVFVGDWNGNFYAIDALLGTQVWKYTLNSTCGTNGASVCQIASSAFVYVDGTGKGTVYFGAHSGSVYALDAATGALIWSTNLGDPKQGYAIF